MMKDKNVSKLSQHKIKKGRVVTPFNDAFGDTLEFNAWNTERLPEYLWLALILDHYGRTTGFEKAGAILYSVSTINSELLQPKLSALFNMNTELQEKVYKTICRYIAPDILAPLTVVYRMEQYQLFNDFFYNPQISVEERISVIENIIRRYYPHQSFKATDLRFLALSLQLFNGRICISKDCSVTAEALKNYAYTSHEDERMQMYRPAIRNIEGAVEMEAKNPSFVKHFWSEIGMLSQCKPMMIEFKKDERKVTDYISDTKDVLKFVLFSNKEKSLTDSKFTVVIGSTNYALRIFNEVIDNKLNNLIMGRHAVRTMIEVYIMLKYLLKKEHEKPNVWREYQMYGISKYKLILLKARENNAVADERHIVTPIIDAIVNEKMWEEFIDIDLRYFDQQGIREKSTYVDEKELYDLYYDYDSNYAHGLWGAVRESAMLSCDNPAHQFHNVPDIDAVQLLPSVQTDCEMIMKKIMNLVNNLYMLPEWYTESYKDDRK